MFKKCDGVYTNLYTFQSKWIILPKQTGHSAIVGHAVHSENLATLLGATMVEQGDY